MFRLFILLFVLIYSTPLVIGQKEYCIERINTPPTIDGLLLEPQWQETDIACDFTTKQPVFGGETDFFSEIHLFYDDYALYIGGELYDRSPDSVSYSLSTRDNTGNADWFGYFRSIWQ